MRDDTLHDELDIPMPSMVPTQPAYRMGARRQVMDADTRRLAIIGGGLAGALLLVAGVSALSGHHGARTIPVVQADSRPLRTKPADSGGMQVSGGDDSILSGESGGADSVLPPPETPAPQTLRAEEQADAKAEAASKAPAAAPPPASTQASTPASGSASAPSARASTPAVAASSPTSAPPAVAPPAASAAAPTADAAQDARHPAGHAAVQLAALGSEAAALEEWHRLDKRMPDLLSGHTPVVQKTEHDGHSFWRLRTGGFADIAQATAFCAQVRAKGGGCTLATF
jgi:cell division septation protein DedD